MPALLEAGGLFIGPPGIGSGLFSDFVLLTNRYKQGNV